MPRTSKKSSHNGKSEQTIQHEILQYLNSLHPDVYVVKVILANKRGVPDLLCCYRGKFIGLEIKQPGGKLSPIQIFEGQLIERAGGKWYRIESLDDVKSVLKGME